MKRFLKVAVLASVPVLLGAMLAFGGNAESEAQNRNAGGWGTHLSNGYYTVEMSSSGHITNYSGNGELGSTNYKWKKVYLADSGIITSTGVTRVHETFLDLAAKGDALVYDGPDFSTTTLATAGTTYISSDLTQPSVPRNIVIITTVGANRIGQSTITVTGTCYVQGLNAVGISTNEYITLVSTGDAAAGRGNVAWAYISSVTISGVSFSGTPPTNLQISIGTSDKIGLVNSISSVNDIYHVNEAGTVTTTYTANATYGTITFATAGNGTNDYRVRYIQKYFTPYRKEVEYE